MFRILKKEWLSEKICLMEIEAKKLSSSAKPGQFLIVKIDELGERIPLTICDYDEVKGTVTIVFFVVGQSTEEMSHLEEGDFFQDVVGPLGRESEFLHENIDELKDKKVLFIAGGVGTAPIYPQVKWFNKKGMKADVIIGAKSKNLVILEKEMKEVAGDVYVATDDGSYGYKGLVTDVLEDLVKNKEKHYDYVVAIGPMIMMKFVCLKTKEYNIKTIVSLNTLMVDGTGMCGACRVRIGDNIKFACVDGPEFDGHKVDFDEAMRRQLMYKTQEGRHILEKEDGDTHSAEDCPMGHDHDDVEETQNKIKGRVPVREQDPKVRATNFKEVTYGYTLEEAMEEAARCLNCKNPLCVSGCPVSIDIPGFIQEVKVGNIKKAGEILMKYTSLPAVCGRVCPQETQCEGKCILGIKGEAVAIGKLEKFVGDYMLNNPVEVEVAEKKDSKVAVVGSGPAGLTVAGDLAKMGYDVTVFEALHKTGGVLTYGIPEFRLPKDDVVQKEINNIKKLGVKFATNEIIGKTTIVDKLLGEEGYEAIFIGSGAGLPRFMNIPGENLNGVFSANEFLTRVNLMKAYKDEYRTPVRVGKKVAVIGGGNVAMDSVRTAKRLGAEAHIVYRRSEKDFPARLEEVHHAKEEGVIVDELTLPKEILGDKDGNVVGMRCIRTKLGEKDASGRASFIEVENSEFIMDVDTVIMALGTSSNTLIPSTTENLEVNRWNGIVTDDNGQTSRPGIFAGGDAVSGAATVILAMGAGKKAAIAIDEYIKSKK
ncbi:bifunctional dihydroorotate dehydrogenase B NAD binding subunit/NADPH-dependent glutamate synthase [Fusobacterium sp. MFO224]|uniref:bifunctional dihydroorotate dehydrogenase B NAD binding subunit/NADPH-dependent glutamate synthase n=1 Tax=Fusobacterium sp. MFO224 TaxID=3378070 RepID=UPI003851D081